jgi:hypothetical protein
MVTISPKSPNRQSKGSKILLIILFLIASTSVTLTVLIESVLTFSIIIPKEEFTSEVKIYQYVVKRDKLVPVTFFRHFIQDLENPLVFPRKYDGLLKFPKNKKNSNNYDRK